MELWERDLWGLELWGLELWGLELWELELWELELWELELLPPSFSLRAFGYLLLSSFRLLPPSCAYPRQRHT